MSSSKLPISFIALLLATIVDTSAQEWTRFRGPNGSGVSLATTVPVKWTDKDCNWKVKLPGVGHSSPVIWGERVFITSGAEDGKKIVVCLKASDGSTLWGKDFPGQKHGMHKDNSFASATPAVDARHLYVSWGNAKEFVVVALDHEGKESWRVDLGPYKAGHGFGASIIVHGHLVVVPNEQDAQSSLVALECGSGKVRWQVPRKSKATYTTPCVFQPADQPAQLIFANYEHGISSVDPATGKLNWELDVFDRGHVETSIGSPIVAGDLVLGLSGWLGVRKEVIAVRPERDGPPKRIYTIDRGVPLVATPLVKDDMLFLWSDEGLVSCHDLATGRSLWRERVGGSYYGSPVCVDKHLYCISREGEVVVIAAAKKFEAVARVPLGEGSHSTPAVADGRMYLRTFSHLVSVGGKN